MKNNYTLVLLISLISLVSFSQNYEFGIRHNSAHNFSIVAIPDFTDNDFDHADIGFTILLPAGDFEAINITQFNSENWTVNVNATAAALSGAGLGDGTKDAILFNWPTPATRITGSHNSGDEIVLVTFDVSNTPSTGSMELLLNTDPIAIGMGGALNSFYNVDLDGPGGAATSDHFSGLASGMESFSFETMSNEKNAFVDVKIFPNPTTEKINITSSSPIESIKLFDVLGKLVLQKKQVNELYLSELPSGVYFLKLQSDNNQMIRKIIKK